jgi:hypothetical protein
MAYLQQAPAARAAAEVLATGGSADLQPSGDKLLEPEPGETAAARDVTSGASSYEAPPVGKSDGSSEAQGSSALLESSAALAAADAGGDAPPVDGRAVLAASGSGSGALVLSDPNFAGLMQPGSVLERAAPGKRVEIHYDEATLNQEIAALLAETSGLPYHDVRVSLRSDRIALSGGVTVLGFGVSAELLGMLVPEDCAPRMEVHAVSVGGVLTPRFVKNQASALVLRALEWYPPDAPLCLDRIDLGEGSVTVYGYRR